MKPIFRGALAGLAGLAVVACEPPTEPGVLTDTPLFAATVMNSQQQIQLPAFAAFIPCALNGAGEFAVVSNPILHVVSKFVIDAAGGVHVGGHFQPMRNWDGVGQVSGDVYQPTGVTRNNINVGASGLPFESTFVNNFRWIGPGPGNNLLVHTNTHVTFNANGTVTANVVNATVDCK